MSSRLFIGLMSGTSVDAVDAALIDCGAPRPRLLHGHSHPFPPALRADCLRLAEPGRQLTLEALGTLDQALGDLFAEAVLALLQAAGQPAGAIRAIGSHGQTLHHRPEGPHPFSLQLGDPNRIAERTGITVVADFRRRDLAAGGEGAPLAPAFHAAVLRDPAETRVVLNIGGIANLTLLPADRTRPVTGFDTGPGNTLLDAWCRARGRGPYDRDGAWAAKGRVREDLLERLLADDYFRRPPPKSTGRERFHPAWLAHHLEGLTPPAAAEDVQATLVELSAATMAAAIAGLAPSPARVLVCGGGVHNPLLLRRLAARLPGIPVQSTATLGLDPDWIEAMAFAWLAQRTLAGQPGNLPGVTGARQARILGGIYPGTGYGNETGGPQAP